MRARIIRVALILAVLAGVAGSVAWFGLPPVLHHAAAANKSVAPPEKPAANPDALRRVAADRVMVPPGLVTRMGLKTAAAATPTKGRSLPAFVGTLDVDPALQSRVYSRFAGEVVSLGTTPEPVPTALPAAPPAVAERPLRRWDRVTKGQTLAVVWSKELGEKKSELLDALSKQRRDEEQLAALKETERSGAVPARSVRDAERDVEADRVAVEKAELTLRSWRLTDAEVAAVREQAARLGKAGGKRPDPAEWARSVIAAPRDGTLVELNTNATAIVDATTPLFVVADLSRLAVLAHVYEEDLPLLQGLPAPVRWTVSLPSRPGVTFPGTLESVGAVIHPEQHTALVTGSVANEDGQLRAGMFVTVTVTPPPPAGEVEVPADAVVEDGRESVVFVRSAADPTAYTRHRVKVARRYRDTVYLTAEPDGVRPGDEVVTAGSLLLNEGMAEQPAPRR
jgi:cobalt-zinc-cadmium efflux system membrane fusion protein